MALHDAIETNLDGVHWIQTGALENAIWRYATGWQMLDLSLPEGLDHRVPDEAARVLESLIPPAASVDTVKPLAQRPSGPNFGEENAPIEAPEEVRGEVEDSLPVTFHILPLMIAAASPAFTIQSVKTDDFMNPLPWIDMMATHLDYDDDIPLESLDDIFTVYNRAFQFNVANLDVANTSFGWLRCVSNLPIVLAYNAGLAHHLQAERDSMDLSYAAALSNYQAAHQFLLGQLLCRQYEPELDLVVMALYHNMGHCYEQLDDKEHAMICFDHMFVAMSGTNQIHRLTPEEDLFFRERLVLGLAEKGKPAAMA